MLDTALAFSHSLSSWNTADFLLPSMPRIFPASGCSSPSSKESRVVLPQPEGPMTQVSSPSGKVWEKS